jgi:chromosome segregation ATPase
MTQKEQIEKLKEQNGKLESGLAGNELLLEEINCKYKALKTSNKEVKDEKAELESSRKGFELQIEGLRKDLEKTKEQKDELGASLNTIEAENTELKAAVIKQAKLLCKDV